MNASPSYTDIEALLSAERPTDPVYCIYPEVYLDAARSFVAGFPGRVLYAVKANDQAEIIRLLHQGGISHFDCASLTEIALIRKVCPTAACYFMVPVRLRGAARQAFEQHGVRHFMVDHAEGIALLQQEIEFGDCVVFTRMAVHHAAALQDLSSKFGALPEQVPGLMQQVNELGAEAALAFNVGSSVTRTEAYTHSLSVATAVLDQLPFKVRLVDIGGGFPFPYPGFDVPGLADYFQAVRNAALALPLAEGGELMAEPGRSLAAPGLSALVEVLMRRDDRLYLNDGMYGIFWELRFREHDAFPIRVYREGKQHNGKTRDFRLYGPTCDASDVLPVPIPLPEDTRTGDYIEVGSLGAYSLSGRTRFNGYYSERIVSLTGGGATPPA